jgi:prepilin-type N-terminal cleavage/methylation domain-containing protein
MKHYRRPRGFTLIELLVVISIIALLIGILMPILGNARDTSENALCLSNLRQLFLSVQMYANDHDDYLPNPDSLEMGGQWDYRLRPGDEVPSTDPRATTFAGLEESLGLPAVLEGGRYVYEAEEVWVCPTNARLQEHGQTYKWIASASVTRERLWEYGRGEVSNIAYLYDNWNRWSPPPGTYMPETALSAWNSNFSVPTSDWEPIHIRRRGSGTSVVDTVNAAYLDGHIGLFNKFN